MIRKFFQKLNRDNPSFSIKPMHCQLLLLSIYSFVSREYFHFERPHWVTFICCAWALCFNHFLGKVIYHRRSYSLSPLVIALASSLLIDSYSLLAYILIITVGLLSKALITFNGRHIFNPANFGVVLALQFGQGHLNAIPNLFGGYILPNLFFFVVGAGLARFAKQLNLISSWLIAFSLFALIRSQVEGIDPWVALRPMLSSSFIIFTFHMLTDPSTTPRTPKASWIFGFLVALFDFLFRYWKIPFGLFYSLFLTSSLMPWITEIKMELTVKLPGKTVF
jgi:Na+-transporting NADH:ubiquinone oxidoreductase subunit NqrB